MIEWSRAVKSNSGKKKRKTADRRKRNGEIIE